MVQATGLMQGKRGVVLGVANNRSIAWGIAKAIAFSDSDQLDGHYLETTAVNFSKMHRICR